MKTITTLAAIFFRTIGMLSVASVLMFVAFATFMVLYQSYLNILLQYTASRDHVQLSLAAAFTAALTQFVFVTCWRYIAQKIEVKSFFRKLMKKAA